MIPKILATLLIGLSGASWTDAETIDVSGRGVVELKPFACQDITRSSVVNRVCYDAVDHTMIVQIKSVYFQFCEIPRATLDAFLNTPSMGQYYKSNVAGGLRDCPAPGTSKP